jgi:hypothetical protein
MAGFRERIGAGGPFRTGLIAVAREQKVRRAPDLDLGCHTRKND